MVQITERIQVIRLCRFRYAIDNRAGFRTIDAVDQLPRMFVQAEAAERSFCYVVVKWNFPISQEHFQCLQSAGFNRRFCGAKRTRCGASGLNL